MQEMTADSYRDAIRAIGDAAAKGYGAEKLFAMHRELEAQRDASGLLFPAAKIEAVYGLDEKETLVFELCCAKLFSEGAVPSQKELFGWMSRIGMENRALSPVFRGAGSGCLEPAAVDYLLERAPDLPEGAYLDPCAEVGPYFREETLPAEFGAFLDSAAERDVYPACILLKGRAGQGKTFAFRKLAERRGCNLLILKTETDPGTAAAVSALYNALVLVPDAEEYPESWIASLEERCGVLLMTTKDMGFSPAGECVLLERELPDLGAEERLAAFRYWFGGESAEWEKVSRFYAMTPGQIMEAARRIRGETLCRRDLSEAEKLEELRSANSREFAGSAQLFRTNKTMEDLILPPAQKRQILDICAFAKARYRVFRDWGFEKKIPYGRGISALFYGASGTGKTFAASVVANELGLRLYRVDISQVISKYIGETQKNIGRIFDSAQNSGCVLFFDEADALFSRRSDAGDSQDKYSNAEIAYLLQRTDQFDGIILMATNLFQNFDEAFRRRIGYMVYFPVPDEKMRRTLWEHIFPEEAPKEELDYGLLADHLELTGAGIRNAAVNAAYLAASRERPISMADVVEAARLEYNKQGKAFPQKLGMMFSSERSRIE